MSHHSSSPDRDVDKLELHHRQQLSALVDGELAPDQARFLLRRLQHDPELSGCYERWQLCGQVMRGQFESLAAPGFGARVAAAIGTDAVAAPAALAAGGSRNAWTRWGGGAAALAASVAAVALLVSRPQAPVPSTPSAAPSMLAADPRPVDPAPALATAPVAPVAVPGPDAVQDVPAPMPAQVAAADTAIDQAPRVRARRQVRPQPVVREPLRVAAIEPVVREAAPTSTSTPVAATAGLAAADEAGPRGGHEPFATAPLDARPWPRAALPQQASGAYTASFGGESSASRTFYPFEPRMPASSRGEDAHQPAPAWDAPR